MLPAGVKLWMRPAAPWSGVDREELFRILAPLSKFEIWADDCDFKAFYDDDGAVAGAPKGVLVASYRRPGGVLAIFGNSTGEKLSFVPRLDGGRLGLPSGVAGRNAETGAPLAGGKVELKPWDLAIVLYAAER